MAALFCSSAIEQENYYSLFLHSSQEVDVMKIYARLLPLLLTALMVFSLVPSIVFADDFSDQDDSFYEEDTDEYSGEEKYQTPLSAVFEGELGEVYVGQDYLDTKDLLYKVGNKFTISYADGTSRVFECRKFKNKEYTWLAFVYNGDKEHPLSLEAYTKEKIKKGANKVGIFFEYNKPDDEYSLSGGSVLKAELTVNVSKLDAEVTAKDSTYNGKILTPKIVVKDGNGKTVPAKAYTVKYFNRKTNKYSSKPVGKAANFYLIKIVFKKAYRDKYISTITGRYDILPKGTKLTKVLPGKKQITLKWKKQTKSMDYYLIEYAADRKFKDSNWVEVSKKKTSYVLKKLKRNKTYYVRMYTAKPISTGEALISKPGKTFKVRVK